MPDPAAVLGSRRRRIRRIRVIQVVRSSLIVITSGPPSGWDFFGVRESLIGRDDVPYFQLPDDREFLPKTIPFE
ncbi:MAG: hypothetical protein WBL53_12570 [Pseudonocardiaceae bacterium]